MNKLKQNLYAEKPWGSEIIWALTDDYMAKTIEIGAGKQTYTVIHEKKEKSIIVVSGDLYLTYGDCCDEADVPVYKLPEGWSWYIESGKLHRYAALDKSVRIVEISTPLFEDGVVLLDEKDADSKEKKLKKPRKKRAKTGQTKKKTQAKKKPEKETKDGRN